MGRLIQVLLVAFVCGGILIAFFVSAAVLSERADVAKEARRRDDHAAREARIESLRRKGKR